MTIEAFNRIKVKLFLCCGVKVRYVPFGHNSKSLYHKWAIFLRVVDSAERDKVKMWTFLSLVLCLGLELFVQARLRHEELVNAIVASKVDKVLRTALKNDVFLHHF